MNRTGDTATIFGAIEAGGTKWICAIGDTAGRILATEVLPTTTPAETLAGSVRFFRRHEPPAAIGVGCFGPLDLHPDSPTYGHITTTPKPGWAYTDVVSPLRAALGVPVRIDTDVNAAALGEWWRGAGYGLETFWYVTVGTGIGAGAVVNGGLVHGLLHPEVGHTRIPHDLVRDPFPGCCPYHGDCLEGLASGEAMRRRWARAPEHVDDPSAWNLEAEYLAHAVLNLTYAISPERIIIGGGVAKHPSLLPRVRMRVLKLVAGYLPTPALTEQAIDQYIVPPSLGDHAGIHGAVELARDALGRPDTGALPHRYRGTTPASGEMVGSTSGLEDD